MVRGAMQPAVDESVTERSLEFDESFQNLAALAHRVARRVLVSGEDAENVAAETMARAQVRWSSVSDHAEAWVVTVASRLAVREARRHRRPLPRVQADTAFDGADGLVAQVDLSRAMRRLPRRQRQAVALRYLADFTDVQAAAAMGCSVAATRTHRARGLASLQAQLRVTPDWIPDHEEGQSP